MKSLKYKNWHVWQGTVGVLLSDEGNKRLQQFDNMDAVINWLYFNGEKEAARNFNKGK